MGSERCPLLWGGCGCSHLSGRFAGAGARASSPASTGAFAPLINRIMGDIVQLRSTTLPLEAPAGPLSPLGWPFDPTREGGLQAGAWVQATPSSYEVTAGACSPFGPPPAHAVVGTSCDGATSSGAEWGGESSYGAKAYPAYGKALGSLALPAPAGRPLAVPVGDGVVGQEYSYRTTVGTYKVPVDLWLIDWTASTCRADFSGCPATALPAGAPVSTAREVVAFARSHPLPLTPGSVLFQDACGDTTSVSGSVTWVQGRDVYSTFAWDSYTVPMLLASMMRPYP
jgi:hypothetical protein